MKKIVFLLILVAILLPYAASAITLNLEYPILPGAPNINEPEGQGLDSLIAWFYVFIISIAGIAAFIMIIWGGIQWMSSSGNTTATTEAMDKIKKAVLGLLLILSSFILLQVINPELTILKAPWIDQPEETQVELCLIDEFCDPVAEPSFTINPTWVKPEEGIITISWNVLNSMTCQKQAPPPSSKLWNSGETIPTLSSEKIGPFPALEEDVSQIEYYFGIVCQNEYFSSLVTVIVSLNEPSTEETTPTVDLKVVLDLKEDNKDGPINYPDDFKNPGGANIGEFTWTSTDTNSCILNIPGTTTPEKINGSFKTSITGDLNNFGFPLNYTITCTNFSSGETVSDAIIIKNDF